MRWLLIVGIVGLMSCSLGAIFVDDVYDLQFAEVPILGLQTPYVIGQWLGANIQYISDTIHDTDDYWQSPDQTYIWRTGDCDDFSILAMYIIRRELGGWPELMLGKRLAKQTYHAWISYNDRWYEPQTGQDVTDDPDYVLLSTVSYGKAMWRSMVSHREMIGE